MERAPLFVDVTARNIDNPDEMRQRRINFYSDQAQRWLRAHNHWALHSGFRVTLEPVKLEQIR